MSRRYQGNSVSEENLSQDIQKYYSRKQNKITHFVLIMCISGHQGHQYNLVLFDLF